MVNSVTFEVSLNFEGFFKRKRGHTPPKLNAISPKFVGGNVFYFLMIETDKNTPKVKTDLLKLD